jgi:hypothetical protein
VRRAQEEEERRDPLPARVLVRALGLCLFSPSLSGDKTRRTRDAFPSPKSPSTAKREEFNQKKAHLQSVKKLKWYEETGLIIELYRLLLQIPSASL